jgi:hypothetical protein
MNLSRLHRMRPRRGPVRRTSGRVLAGGLMLAAIASAVAATGPAALASRSSAAARSAQSASGVVVSWSESPASATAPDARSVFSYTNIKPGSTITDHVAVLNRSKQDVAFTVYATDASGTTPGNVLELLPSGVKPHDIGSWVTFPKGQTRLSIVIGADQGIIEPFTISVPLHATPGDHTGGMIAQVGFTRRTTKGSLVIENQRIAVPIELRVAGALHPGLQVESISTGFRNPLSPFGTGSASVAYTVYNSGNVRLTGSQVVSVTGPFGISSKVRLNNLPTVLPGDSVRLTVRLAGLFPFGAMTAKVRVGPAVPKGAPAEVLPVASITGSASLFAVPWTLIGVIILVLLASFGGWRLRRWQRRRLGGKLAAVAEGARRETERRLLGSKDTAAGPKQQA